MEQQDKKEKRGEYRQREVAGGVYAIKNTQNGKTLIMASQNLQGSRNRFDFSRKTGGCINPRMQEDWKKYGPEAFVFQELETLVKKENQTPKEFSGDIKVLEELWIDRFEPDLLY